MTVHFIGAGPGAADLLTLRGRDIINRCPVCLYAGSLIPAAILSHIPKGARAIDTAPLTLNDIIAEITRAHAQGHEISRLHSGDPSLYGAIAEQIRRLRHLRIPFSITPGVPAYAAAAAALETELTLPGLCQTVILTRTTMKASPMPSDEQLEILAASRATLAIHLSIRNMAMICKTLIPYYGETCPVAVVYRASWPDQQILRGNLTTIKMQIRDAKITRTALILVGRVLAEPENIDFVESALYDPEHVHLLRPHRKEKPAEIIENPDNENLGNRNSIKNP